MEKRKIGKLEVSVLGLGCNQIGTTIDEKQSANVVAAALDHGVNFFDTADEYGGGRSEEYLGKALRGKRDKVIIATKFGHGGARTDGAAAGRGRRERALDRDRRGT